MVKNSIKAGYQTVEYLGKIIQIPKDWQKIQIGNHFNFKNGLNKAKKFFGQGTPIINYMDVYPHSAIEEKNIHGKVTLSNEELRNFDIKKGDILFTRTSETIEEIGLSSVVLDDVKKTVFSGFLLRARPKTKLFELEFKQYCFRSKNVRKQIISTSSQTTRALTNGKLLSKLSILIPINPQEQKNIAESILDIEKLVKKLEIVINKKKNIKQGTMQELLTGKRKLSGSKEKWKLKEFRDVINEFSSGSTPYRGKSEYYNGKIRWITSGELNYNYITDTIEKISKNAMKETNLRLHPKGTFVIAITGLEAETTRGRCGIIDEPSTTNQSCMALYPNNDLSLEFLFQYYRLKGNELAFKYCQGTKQQSYTVHIVKRLPIKIPPTIEEQSIIAKILSDIDSEIKELETKRDKYIMIKQGMMQKLLTGEIRLT